MGVRGWGNEILLETLPGDINLLRLDLYCICTAAKFVLILYPDKVSLLTRTQKTYVFVIHKYYSLVYGPVSFIFSNRDISLLGHFYQTAKSMSLLLTNFF